MKLKATIIFDAYGAKAGVTKCEVDGTENEYLLRREIKRFLTDQLKAYASDNMLTKEIGCFNFTVLVEPGGEEE